MGSDAVHGRVIQNGEGLAGVAVSDGLHVVRTGKDGSFTLPGHGAFVTLTTPTGSRAERWYFERGAVVDFVLEPDAQERAFQFAVIGDVHIGMQSKELGPNGDAVFWQHDGGWKSRSSATAEDLGDLLLEIADRFPEVAFVVALGDVTDRGTDEQFASYMETVRNTPVPVIAIPGNHDHMTSLDVDAGGSGYERHLGPRWFSFEFGGVHFAAIDWYTHYLGIDPQEQRQWLEADLSSVGKGMPVVLLTHDQMLEDFYRRLPVAPVASFSGHWHTSRVVGFAGAVHYNSGTPTFGGLDYSPAHYRVCNWNGNSLDVETVARAPAELSAATFRTAGAKSSSDALWSTPLSGGVHRNSPVVMEDVVVCTSMNENAPEGWVEALEVASGELRWRARLSSSVKAPATAAGRSVVAAAVSGEVVCIDADEGSIRWLQQIDHPLRLWVYLRPATDGFRVFAGDTPRLVCLDMDSGELIWMREDLGTRGNITCLAHPVVADDLLIVSFAAQANDIWALNPATGETVWPADGMNASIEGLSREDRVAALMKMPASAFGVDPLDQTIYTIRLGSRLDRLAAADGSVLWSAQFRGWFNPAPPVATREVVIAAEGSGIVRAFSRDSGELQWETRVSNSCPLRMGPYRDAGACLLASPAVVEEFVLIPSGDGRIYTLDIRTGRVKSSFEVGSPIAADLAIAGGSCFTAGVDGVVRAFPLERLLH